MTDSLHQPQEPEDSAVTFERLRKRKVMLVALVLGLLCALFIWQLFSESTSSQEGCNSINVTIPDGKAERTEGDKRKASEQVRTSSQQNQRVQTLGDNSFSLLDDGLKPTAEPSAADDPVQRAAEANRALTTQVHSFYTHPRRNEETEQLQQHVDELKAQLDIQQQYNPRTIAEEQYKLAQKYLCGGKPPEQEDSTAKPKARISVMRPVQEGAVEASTLNPNLADFATERNLGFLTATQEPILNNAPTVRACIAQSQVVRAGNIVKLRLQEAVRIDGVTIPRNAPIYGEATITGMRLQIIVSSIAYEGHIFALEATVYDLDGQPGLNIPNTKERTALKEALASVGQSAGMSVNVTHSAGQQIISELSRGGLQASSRYLSEKLREVKITLKANHQVLLISKE